MKKTGIVTFHFAYNYGAVLQAYAMQRILANLDQDVEFVDYTPAYHKRRYRSFFTPVDLYKEGYKRTGRRLRALVSSVGALRCNTMYFKKNAKKKAFVRFMRANFKLSPNCREFKDIEKISKRYEKVFYGSDQIWNKNITSDDFDPVYWGLGFDKNIKKVAYAASAGNRFDVEDKDKITGLLANFNAVSVRERDLASQINDWGVDCRSVLDPVMLLPKPHWEEIAEKSKITAADEKHLLVYRIFYDEELYEKAAQIAEKHHLKIREIALSSPVGQAVYNAGPDDFVSLIRNAEYVVTNSFHATVLSVIFQKVFFVVLPKDRASRIEELLSQLSLRDRIILDGHFPPDHMRYDEAEMKIAGMVKESLEFIKSNL